MQRDTRTPAEIAYDATRLSPAPEPAAYLAERAAIARQVDQALSSDEATILRAIFTRTTPPTDADIAALEAIEAPIDAEDMHLIDLLLEIDGGD